MTDSRQRTLPVLAILLAAGLSAAPTPAHAQPKTVEPYARELYYGGLDKDDPRRASSRTAPTGEHKLLEWVSNRIYILRPAEPGPHRKAELSFSKTDDPGVLYVSRRTLGTLEIIEGEARLDVAAATHFSPFGAPQQFVLVLDVRYHVQDTRGARGALGQEQSKAARRYGGRYAIRAKGDVLIGETTAPGAEGKFEEKGLSQGVRYRRAGTLMDALASADPEEKKRLEALTKVPVVTKCWVMEFSASAEENTSIRREDLGGVSFYFNPPEEIGTSLGMDKPRHVFVMAHGWQNDREVSLEFASRLVLGIRERMLADGVPEEQFAFVFVSWNSKRTNFMESALCAETIGHRGVAPLLRDLRAKLPSSSLTLLGHSLGGRMMLATLQGPDPKQGKIGRWKQNRFRAMKLVGRDALDGAFWRMLHIALRGRTAPAPKVNAVVLLEAAIDVQTLHAEIGLLNYGDTPNAAENAKLIANAHSRNDEILRLAYTASNGVMNIGSTIMKLLDDGDGIQALGRLGAERAPGQQFASMELKGDRVDMGMLRRQLKSSLSKPLNAPANRVVNVDITSLLPKAGTPKPGAEGETWGKVESHTEINHPAIYDLVWQATKLTSKTASAK